MYSIVRVQVLALAVLLAFCLFLNCCNVGQASPQSHLPRGFGDIILGEKYDPLQAGAGPEFSTPDGIRHIRIDRAENIPPVDVEIDRDGIVRSISWGLLVAGEDRKDSVKSRAKERYGKFLVQELSLDGESALMFEDENTLYRLRIRGYEVRFSITNLLETPEDKGTP